MNRLWVAAGIVAVGIGATALVASVRTHLTPQSPPRQVASEGLVAPHDLAPSRRADAVTRSVEGPPPGAINSPRRPAPPRCVEADVDRLYRELLYREGVFAETRHREGAQP